MSAVLYLFSPKRLRFVTATTRLLWLLLMSVSFAQFASAKSVLATTVDSAGNIYLTGATDGTLQVTPGALQTTFVGGDCSYFLPLQGTTHIPCSDAFVEKVSPNGTMIWATYLGGNYSDAGIDIAVDATGNVFISGRSDAPYDFLGNVSADSNTFPKTPGAAFSSNNRGGTFIVKIDPSGSRMIYGTVVPYLSPSKMAVDSNGAVHIVAQTGSSSLITPGAYQSETRATHTIFALKLNPEGSALVYGTYLSIPPASPYGGAPDNSESNFPTAITLDPQGNAVITGVTLKNGNQSYLTFVAKLNASGSSLISSATFGTGTFGIWVDAVGGYSVAADGQGRITALGQTYEGAIIPITAGAFEPDPSQPAWAVGATTKNLASGLTNQSYLFGVGADGLTLRYSTYFTNAYAMTVDTAGNSYVAAKVGPGFPVSPNGIPSCTPVSAGLLPLVAELDPDGKLVAATYYPSNFLVKGQDGTATMYGDGPARFAIANPIPFFTGQTAQGNCAYSLQFPNGRLFGSYTFGNLGWIQHADLGNEYFIPDANGGDGIYLFDATSQHWFYTGASIFPYLYDFTLNTWLYYFADSARPGHYSSNPRVFANMATGQVLTM